MEEQSELEKTVQTSCEALRPFRLPLPVPRPRDASTQTDRGEPVSHKEEPKAPTISKLGKKRQSLLQIFKVAGEGRLWSKVVQYQGRVEGLYKALEGRMWLGKLQGILQQSWLGEYLAQRFHEEGAEGLPGGDQGALVSFLKNYRFSNRKIDRDQFRKSKVNIKRYKNCAYFGGMHQSRKHGIGLLVFNDGRRYQGGFEDDLRSGFGVELGQQIYVGDWARGLREGFGVTLQKGGGMHAGYYKGGRKVGIGVQVEGGERILGEFQPQGIAGFCVRWDQGELFVGMLSAGGKTGVGLQRFKNGDVYAGTYEEQPHGYGEYYWQNGAVYRGEFLNGLRHGKGKWAKAGGDSYQGEYRNDKKCGVGKYLWGNGAQYIGQFHNDLRHGEGVMLEGGVQRKSRWANGYQQKQEARKAKS